MDTVDTGGQLSGRLACTDTARGRYWAVPGDFPAGLSIRPGPVRLWGKPAPSQEEDLTMATFVFTYRAPQNYTLGTPDGIAAWSSWFESMGAHLADMGQPVAEATTVGDCGEIRPLGGYSLITADDLGEAVALANGSGLVTSAEPGG